jgi:N-dimethylarginine dimethylaminohydrolase
MNMVLQTAIVRDTGKDGPGVRPWTYVMCPPDHFRIAYEINPWMARTVQPDPQLAQEQWQHLVANLQQAGATVELLQPVAALPDMVFTADIGLVDQRRFITSRFHHSERQPEVQHGVDWFHSRNYEVIELPQEAETSMESSDICPFRDFLFAGYGFRTTFAAHKALARLCQRKLLSIEFVDPRLYHLDLSFCPLDDRRAMIAPCAWSRRSCALLKSLVPEPLVLDLSEALTFCANAIVVGKTIIMPACPVRVGRILERWGFTVCVSPVSEFLKAGGGVHCLTLALHEPLSGDE